MDAETAEDLRELVQYDDETAGGLMTTDYVWIYPHRTVAATIAQDSRAGPRDRVHLLPLRRRPIGEAARRALAAHAPALLPDATIHTIMDTDLVSVAPTTRPSTSPRRSRATICWPVRSSTRAGKMLGIVTVDDAIDAIIPERLKKQLPRLTRTHGGRERIEA